MLVHCIHVCTNLLLHSSIFQLEKDAESRAKLRANQNVKDLWSEERLASYGEASCLGAHRVRTDHWRGFNTSQKQAVAAENVRIVAAKKAKQEEEARRARAYQNKINKDQRTLELMETEAAEARKAKAAKQLASHLQTDREDRDRKKKETTCRNPIQVLISFLFS